jgi:hypothetical protein
MEKVPDYSDLAVDYKTGLLESTDIAPHGSYPRFGPSCRTSVLHVSKPCNI